MAEAEPAARIYEVRAGASRADVHPSVLKHGDTFAVLDHFGNVEPAGRGEEGIYHRDARHLSCLELTLNGSAPMLLSSSGVDNGVVRTKDFTNLDLFHEGNLAVPFGTLHITRSQLLWRDTFHERIRLSNFGDQRFAAQLRMSLDADFVDIFEVRGTPSAEHGYLHPVERLAGGLRFRYDGRDGRTRTTLVAASPHPDLIEDRDLIFNFTVTPHQVQTIELSFAFEETRMTPSFELAAAESANEQAAGANGYCRIRTSNEQVDEWLRRSATDMQMLVTKTEHGLYPYAGVPWFSTVFGRDGIIAALQTLWVNPDIARGVLRVLAANQANMVDLARAAEPGKIVHELRGGELSALGIVPFEHYYGSADATPLFVMLAGDYLLATGDVELAAELWPNVQRALDWIEQYGDRDGDGFVEYGTDDARGLTNQGWKDSWDSVFHADGSQAPGPIALVEVQAYVYAAYRAAAQIAETLGEGDRAAKFRHAADDLRARFDTAFWCERLQTYALALDGDKRQCEVRTSNAGHALFAGIALPERAPRVVSQLLSPVGFSGWGVRTVAQGEARYNPMSYHNGSVWPHDTAMIARGLGRYGFIEGALELLSGLFHASLYLDLRRLPELFCGFERRAGDGPTLYPLACAPQAWASGGAFMLLDACLGITVDARQHELRFRFARLPEFIQELELRELRVGNARMDLLLQRHTYDIGINVLRREGDVTIVALK